MWINRKSVFEWNGNEYVEVYSDKYRYEGEVALAQSRGPQFMLQFMNWFEKSYPGVNWMKLTADEQQQYIRDYKNPRTSPSDTEDSIDIEDGNEVLSFSDWLAQENITQEQYNRMLKTVQNEMKSRYNSYVANFGSEDEEVTNLPTDDTADDTADTNEPRQVGEKYIDSAGNLWTTYEEAYASNVRIGQAEAERAERVGDFEKRFDEYERLIEEGSAEEKELAQRMSARMRGQLERRIEDSILATGGEVPEGFEERLAESSTRQLLEITSNIEQRRIAQLTGAKQYEIGTDMNLEQIGLSEQNLEQQMTQFLASQAQRESQFQSTLGLQQAELALREQLGFGQLNLSKDQLEEQKRQFDVGLDYQLTPEEQMKAALWGSIGEGVGTLGSFFLSKLPQG